MDIVLRDRFAEGVASWTTDVRFAELFKGRHRPDAVSGAIFEHQPATSEVILNVGALWADPEFAEAVGRHKARGGKYWEALVNFRDRQGEVVLSAPLRGTEIIALTGASSPFDELCDEAGIPEEDRNRVFKTLVDQGVYPGELQYLGRAGAQRAISNSIRRLQEKLEALRSTKP